MRISDLRSDVCSSDLLIDDALGGKAYYKGRLELDIPLGAGAKEMGLRPSIFVDVGSVFSVVKPELTTLANFTDPSDGLTKYLCRNSAEGTSQFATQGTDSKDRKSTRLNSSH